MVRGVITMMSWHYKLHTRYYYLNELMIYCQPTTFLLFSVGTSYEWTIITDEISNGINNESASFANYKF